MGAKREYIEWLKSVPCEQTARPGSYPTAEQLLQVKMDSLPMVDHEFFTQDIGERSGKQITSESPPMSAPPRGCQ